MSIYPEGRGPLDYMRRLARGLLPAFQCPEISPRHHSGPLVLLPSSALLGSSEKRQDTLSLSPHIRLGVQDAREVSLNPGSRIHPASKGQWGGRRKGGGIPCGPTAVCRLPSAACRRSHGSRETGHARPSGSGTSACCTNVPVSSQECKHRVTHTDTHKRTHIGESLRPFQARHFGAGNTRQLLRHAVCL